MSRIRSVHPGFFRDEDLVSCSAFARLLFIGLGAEADDKGIFEWKPVQIKMAVFPGDNVEIVALLAELLETGNIRQFEAAGKRYGAIKNFRKFQKPKTPNDIHPMPNDVAEYVAFPRTAEASDDEPEPFPRKVENAPQMEDGGEEVEEKKEISLEAEREFEAWYEVYPRHVGKGQARKSYRSARKKASAETLMGGARAAAVEFAGKDQQYVPHPSTWLGGERWLDSKPPFDGSPPGRRYDFDADPVNRGVL